jgi:hypothetical protein
MYWACAQVEPRRERLASHCLTLAGYEIYQPLLRAARILDRGGGLELAGLGDLPLDVPMRSTLGRRIEEGPL